MDINIGWVLVNAWASVAPWLFGALAYGFGVFLICLLLDYVFGRNASDWAARILLLPLWLVRLLAEALAQIRNRRRLWDWFKIADLDEFESNERLVEETLTKLACYFYDAVVDQEITRKLHPANIAKLKEAAIRVDFCKTTFWQAHKLASDNRFLTRPKYELYVPYDKRIESQRRF